MVHSAMPQRDYSTNVLICQTGDAGDAGTASHYRVHRKQAPGGLAGQGAEGQNVEEAGIDRGWIP